MNVIKKSLLFIFFIFGLKYVPNKDVIDHINEHDNTVHLQYKINSSCFKHIQYFFLKNA